MGLGASYHQRHSDRLCGSRASLWPYGDRPLIVSWTQRRHILQGYRNVPRSLTGERRGCQPVAGSTACGHRITHRYTVAQNAEALRWRQSVSLNVGESQRCRGHTDHRRRIDSEARLCHSSLLNRHTPARTYYRVCRNQKRSLNLGSAHDVHIEHRDVLIVHGHRCSWYEIYTDDADLQGGASGNCWTDVEIIWQLGVAVRYYDL